MDSFEWNKIAGWVLTASVAVLGLSLVTGEVFKPVPLEKPAYVVEGVEAEATEGPAAPAEKPIEFFLASASAEKGAAVFKKCGACHNAEKGGAAGIGPNLYGVVGAAHGAKSGFSYSAAMQGFAGKTWGWSEINAWLLSPKAYMPGNKMAFAGISKPEDRAAVIVYLNSKSDKPLAVPPVPAEAPPADPVIAADPTAAADPAASKAASTVTPASEKPAPQPGKAPDVPAGSTGPSKPQGTEKSDPA